MITYNNEDYIPYKNAMELIEEKDKEIERLQKILRTKTRLHRKRKAKVRKLREEITNKQKRLELLNSIIKEAREYINNHQLVFEISSKKQIAYWFDMFYKELLEILDKAGKGNDIEFDILKALNTDLDDDVEMG